MKYNTSQLSAMSRMFSSAVFQELAKNGRSSLFRRLLDQARVPLYSEFHSTVGDAFNSAFTVLKSVGLRDEYVYRSAITKKVLLGKHSLRTASMLNEFRVGKSKADLVVLNGTATVYEIKSERDSLARLVNQIKDYKRVFSAVNVISSEKHIEGVRSLVSDDVGIMCLTSRYQISIERDAIDSPDRVCPISIFESLRSSDAIAVLKGLGVSVPDVPNTRLRAAMLSIFAELDPATVHREMVCTLKRTRNLAPLSDLVDQLPDSLHAAALSIPVRRMDHCRLIEAVRIPLLETRDWV